MMMGPSSGGQGTGTAGSSGRASMQIFSELGIKHLRRNCVHDSEMP